MKEWMTEFRKYLITNYVHGNGVDGKKEKAATIARVSEMKVLVSLKFVFIFFSIKKKENCQKYVFLTKYLSKYVMFHVYGF